MTENVPARHKAVANFLILLIAIPTLYCTVTEAKMWPFAPFDMYSQTLTPECSQYYLEGEARDGRRISLTSGGYLHPFSNRALIFKIFPPLLRRPAQLDERLRLLARHYEERRQRGQHRGPQLTAMRLYRVTWRLAPNAANLDFPEEESLLREVRW